MALNIEVESKPTGRVQVRVYCDETTPATSEHLMNCVRTMHADMVNDVAKAWGIEHTDVETSGD